MNIKRFWKRTIGFVFAAMLLFTAPAVTVSAAEFSVTQVKAVLYTNDETMIFADADAATLVLPEVAPDLPIAVTGITSNGYFRIDLGGQTFYINGAGLKEKNTGKQAANTISNRVYDAIVAQKANFPEGMPWTNSYYYEWQGGIFDGGYGCAAFAFAMSDAAFGNAPAVAHNDYSNIKVGDILRIYNDTHSVVVLEVRDNSVIVTEGNYDSAIHWGREIPKANLVDPSSYILTRY